MSKYDKLIADFPDIYLQHGYNPDYTVGFCIGEGWYDLLKDLSQKIQDHVNKNPDASISITDIKEKFGGLRYYYNGGDEVIDDLVNDAENKSYEICELCGAPGELMTSGYWLSTRCKEHTKEGDRPMKKVQEEIEEKLKEVNIEEDDQKPETD